MDKIPVYPAWSLLCEMGLFSIHLKRYFCFQMANGVCEHLLFQHLITDNPNRSRVNAMSACVHVCKWVGVDMEWVTDNSKRGEREKKNEKGLIWFGSGEVIIPFPHFTAHP